MKRFTFFVMIVALLAAVAFFTKPTDEKCLQQARVEVKSQIRGDINQENRVISNVLDKVVTKAVRVEDQLLYKSITYSFGGKRKQIGWGAFGMVHIVARN